VRACDNNLSVFMYMGMGLGVMACMGIWGIPGMDNGDNNPTCCIGLRPI
jgi:hypothetical protein